MQAVADPSLVALANCMAGKQSKSLAKPDAMPSAASSCSASPMVPVIAKQPKQSKNDSTEAALLKDAEPAVVAPAKKPKTKEAETMKKKAPVIAKQPKQSKNDSTEAALLKEAETMEKKAVKTAGGAEPTVVTPTKKRQTKKAETTEKKKKKTKKRRRASPVSEKPSKPLREGFSGVTSRSDHCWICGHEREELQKGSACTLCCAHGRKLQQHQRLSELREKPELLERVQQMTAEVRKQRQSKKKTSRREDLMARFEEAMNRLPQLEDLLKKALASSV